MRFLICSSLLLIMQAACMKLQAQQDSLQEARQVDVADVVRSVFKTKPKEQPGGKASISLLPVLGYNPSFGFNIGVNLMAGKQFGLKTNTIYSVFNLTFSYSTKKIIPL